jgi:hypothetical protein
VDKNMRALKALVIIMGIAIIAGLAVLVTLIIERGSRLAGDGRPAAVQTAPGGTRTLALPVGARVLETRLDGDRLALRVALAGAGEAIFVFDASSGRLVTRYDLAPATP